MAIKEVTLGYSRGRMIWMYILLCSIPNFFQIYPIGLLQSVGRGFPFLVFQLFWLWYGIERYREYEDYNIKESHLRFVIWLFVLMLPSIYMANVMFNQSLLQSIVSYRQFLLYLTIPALFIIDIKTEELIDALYYFSLTAFIIAVLQNYIMPSLFVFTERDMNSIMGGYGHYDVFPKRLGNLELMMIPIYYYSSRIKYNMYRQDIFRIVVLFIILLSGQNRSTIFPSAVFVAYCFLFSKTTDKFVKYSLIICIGIIVSYYLIDKISSMIDLTEKQITSSYDPRVVALNYFLDFHRMSIPQILFGTGIISYNTSDYLLKLQQAHIHYSDVGFVGFWYQFGIAPTLFMLYAIIKGVISKNSALYVKFIGCSMLICGITISYFAATGPIVWFVCFFYLWKQSEKESEPEYLEDY